MVGVHAAEAYFPGSGADVQGLARFQREVSAIHLDPGGPADVDQAQFAPGQKIFRADPLGDLGIERHGLMHRHHTPDDDTVHVTVG